MKRNGFTLLEIMVAAGIIMILTTIGVASYANLTRRSRDARRSSDLEQIRQALEMYRADNGFYPAVNTGAFATAANLAATIVPTYMPVLPRDPRDSATQRYLYYATNATSGQYYGYCICGRLEAATTTVNTCSGVTLPANCNYGQKSP